MHHTYKKRLELRPLNMNSHVLIRLNLSMLKCLMNCFAQVSRLNSGILFITKKKNIENTGENTVVQSSSVSSAGLHTKGDGEEREREAGVSKGAGI